jgi:hypothetical protein
MKQSIASIFLKWFLRFLLLCLALLALLLLIMNSISGSGDAQRRGLEQAFSDGLKIPVTIGTLNDFNVVPQFKIDASLFKIGTPNDALYLMADQIIISFSLWDMLLNKKTIQEFTIQNADFILPFITSETIQNSTIQILRPEPVNPARLYLNGKIKGKPIELYLTLQSELTNTHYNYKLAPEEVVTLQMGNCNLNGKFIQEESPHFKWDIPAAMPSDCLTFKNFIIRK